MVGLGECSEQGVCIIFFNLGPQRGGRDSVSGQVHQPKRVQSKRHYYDPNHIGGLQYGVSCRRAQKPTVLKDATLYQSTEDAVRGCSSDAARPPAF